MRLLARFISFIILSWFIAVVGLSKSASAQQAIRVGDGLLVAYSLDDSASDGTIRDRSRHGESVDLRPTDASGFQTKNDKLTIESPSLFAAPVADSKRIAKRLTDSKSVTVEVWIRAANLKQKGPARIVSFSKDANKRNFTLGQDGSDIELRIRTTKSDLNGLPGIRAAAGTMADDWTHCVATVDQNRTATMYINGNQAANRELAGTLGRWDDSFQLSIGNEITGGRPWLGDLSLVAIYDRALTSSEVRQNFSAGRSAGFKPSAPQLQAIAREKAELHFERKIAPILSNHCLECHDSASREGGLDLSRKTFAFAGGDSGGSIVPGDLENSLVWTSVESDEMPHDRPLLSPEQKVLLKDWITSGATWSLDYVDPSIYRHVVNEERWVSRLTIDEYIETVRATFGVDIESDARRLLPEDVRADGFRNTAYNLTVDFGHVSGYSELADLIVAKLDVVGFCKPFAKNQTLTDDNMRPLISDLGRRVLRSPLSSDEVALYRGITTTVALAGGGYEESLAYVISAMLQSPKFLYRLEPSRLDRGANGLTPYQVANRISYTLWGAPPDDALMQAAEQGQLSSAADIQGQLDRMWMDPRSVDRSIEFVSQWLDLERLQNLNPDKSRFPNWQSDLAADMRRETIEVFREVVWQQEQPLADLLGATFTYLTPRLAKHYGLKPQSKPWARYDLTKVPSRRGLLTHGSLLTIGGDNASMVTRGLFVLQDLLFSEVGDPPPGLDTTPVPTEPGLTHRMVAMERVESESCGGCHSRFEPLAYALEKYDGLGTFTDRDEHGNALREDGEILFPGDAKPVPYQTTGEMIELLSSSDRVAQSLTRKLVQFCLGRPLDAADARMVDAVYENAGRRRATYQSIVNELLLYELVN